MKALGSLLLFLSLVKVSTCFSQVYVDGVAIDTVNTPFCQLICDNATIMTRAKILVDYGQRFVDSGLNRQKIAGADRKPISFNSSIDALNFMVRQGWELVSCQIIGTSSGSESTFIYLLQRKKKFTGID
ncbi:hypothetical protein [Spirosoma areae]